MQGPLKPTLLLLVMGLVFTAVVPVLVYSLLPDPARTWVLGGGGTISDAVLKGLVGASFIGGMAYFSYVVWLGLARRIFGRDYIDTLVAQWSRRP